MAHPQLSSRHDFFVAVTDIAKLNFVIDSVSCEFIGIAFSRDERFLLMRGEMRAGRRPPQQERASVDA